MGAEPPRPPWRWPAVSRADGCGQQGFDVGDQLRLASWFAQRRNGGPLAQYIVVVGACEEHEGYVLRTERSAYRRAIRSADLDVENGGRNAPVQRGLHGGVEIVGGDHF